MFAVFRFMGSSIAMIDYHYRHLARDSREHAVSLLDALAIETSGGRWVDAAPEGRGTFRHQRFQPSWEAIAASGGRSVDAEASDRRVTGKQKELISRNLAKPSDGLEPSTGASRVPRRLVWLVSSFQSIGRSSDPSVSGGPPRTRLGARLRVRCEGAQC